MGGDALYSANHGHAAILEDLDARPLFLRSFCGERRKSEGWKVARSSCTMLFFYGFCLCLCLCINMTVTLHALFCESIIILRFLNDSLLMSRSLSSELDRLRTVTVLPAAGSSALLSYLHFVATRVNFSILPHEWLTMAKHAHTTRHFLCYSVDFTP